MEFWYSLTVGAGRSALAALGVRTRFSGLERLPRYGPAILASVHVGYPDFMPIADAGRRRGRNVRFMCRHDVWNKRRWAVPMNAMRHIPVDREAPAGAYLRARRLLAAGEVVSGFPEAGISYSFTVRPLMRGIAALARDTGAPVIPVALWGTQRLYTVGRPRDGREPPPDLTRGRLIDLRMGRPMRVSADDDLTEWTQQLGHRLAAMLQELQLLPEHRPRPGEYAPWYPAHLGGHAPDLIEARQYDEVPRAAVRPTWPPGTPPPAEP